LALALTEGEAETVPAVEELDLGVRHRGGGLPKYGRGVYRPDCSNLR
jgi:hypothetical protein